MTTQPVRGHRNEIVVEAARLHRSRVRSEANKTLIEGPNLLVEAVAAGVGIDTVFALPTDLESAAIAEPSGLRLTLVDERAMGRLAGTETPRGPVAVIHVPDPILDKSRNLLVGWGLSDPGNVGTIIRTAAAFGWGYADIPRSADPWSPKALRAGAGGQFQTPIGRVDGLHQLGDWITVATIVSGGIGVDSVEDRPVAVLIGEEASGLPDDVVDWADHRISVGLTGPTESLNAASAAAILVHALSKGGEPRPGGV